MILNRLNITGALNFNTPKIVLYEIADSLSIKNENNPNRLILKINKASNRNKIVENYEDDIASLRIIARYVNCNNKNWRRSLLLKAFKFLNSFEKDRKVDKNFIYGIQTSEKPESLNACILYRLCRNYNIYTSYNTNIHEMANNIKLYLSETSLKIDIFNYIKFNATKSDLVNMSSLVGISGLFKPEIINEEEIEKKEKYTYEDYENCTGRILDIDDQNIPPKNGLEAIVMAALYYKLDLSDCEKPMNEYKALSKNPYFPSDEKLKKRLKQSYDYPDNICSPYLNNVFNWKLPENMYSHRDLVHLCGEEGIYDNDSHYSSLQLAYLTETFIHGKQKNIINETTTFLENIEDLEYDEVVLYGIRSEGYYKAYTYGELADTFSNYKRFLDPRTNQIFSEDTIEKLYLLTQKDKRKTETEEMYRERIDLGEEIERIKIYIGNKNEYVDNFLDIYENLNDYDKKKVEKCLNNLLHVAMYMRNWDGVSDYPLNSEDTNFSEEKQIVVDHRVTQSLIVFEESLKSLGRLGDYILNLPLMQYHKESSSFITSNDPSEGLTIKERIDIVRGGENSSINSCIRMSSNKFCATSFYYMVLIGFRMPFNISEVSQIF